MGEKVQDARTVPGLGDEAAIVYSVGTTDSGLAHVVVRLRNVEMIITYQGANVGDLGPKPLSRREAEQGALATARELVAEFR